MNKSSICSDAGLHQPLSDQTADYLINESAWIEYKAVLTIVV